MSQKTLEQWLAEIEAKHPQEIDLGLERIKTVAHCLQLDSLAVPVITVAGTNGKGSTIAYMASILKAAGYTVGAYTSPHFICYNERVSVNDIAVDDSLFCHAFEVIDQACQRLDVPLTYFEYGTLAAFWIFQSLIDQQQLDVVLLEVGLGGRLDAVNIIDPSIAIVTTVALDHQSWLGSTREEIGVEKAGIYRKNTPALYGEEDIPDSVQQKITSLKTKRFQLSSEFYAHKNENDWEWHGLSFSGAPIQIDALPYPLLPFDNGCTAIQALQLLNLPIEDSDYREGLINARLTGRFQGLRHKGKNILLDVAHNPHAARNLSQFLVNQPCKQIYAIVGMLSDKDVKGTLDPLSDQVSCWYAGTIHETRGLTATELKQQVPNFAMESNDTITSAFDAALKRATESDLVLVMGSFFTVAEILSYVRESSIEQPA